MPLPLFGPDDDREVSVKAGYLESAVLLVVLLLAAVVIGALLCATYCVRLVTWVMEDPNASPYRQVR